jgi:hypothetical protein
MSFRLVRRIAGIGNVFLGTELVDSADMISRSTRRILKITSVMEPTGYLAPRRSRALQWVSCPSGKILGFLQKKGTQ